MNFFWISEFITEFNKFELIFFFIWKHRSYRGLNYPYLNVSKPQHTRWPEFNWYKIELQCHKRWKEVGLYLNNLIEIMKTWLYHIVFTLWKVLDKDLYTTKSSTRLPTLWFPSESSGKLEYLTANTDGYDDSLAYCLWKKA